ncbi:MULTISPECIES: TetR/AcrR family transcriptional regulator [Streptomyces]|uniref:TetR family transcriptional regulator n=1 Tax=Streptomyces xanthochromogenes TaxID=67384 RepID=A0ABQ2ZJK3_9ACTN|nr:MULTISPECIES: TetR/AcrR family transcriptional regulator [Streptomyces]MYV91812.1 TetR family transcriptional regulator [Streptomyces sp. SID1034]GGY16908.1 TetR family transcriptional regulator [Streptomyces xanthochromogenes]
MAAHGATNGQLGRRERKKAQTRRTIAETALRLFLERGYDAVGVREVAQEADVATATLFAHFPSKEALVFDQDDEQEEALLDVVRARPEGVSIPEALRRWFHGMVDAARNEPDLDRFHRLIETTPALRDYSARMWLRHEQALADVIAADIGLAAPDTASRLVARTALGVIPSITSLDEGARIIDVTFDFVEAGWTATAPAADAGATAGGRQSRARAR